MRASSLGDSGDLRALLARVIDQESVPGAALGVISNGATTCVSAGTLSRSSGEPVTDDSLFQIGSITKVWTATMVMALWDRGALDVDRPVHEVLPGFRLASPGTTRQVTLRHLLSHSSGVAGDFFVDTGSGDDCVARYTALLRDLEPTHRPGSAVSYCNTGFVVAARVVESLTSRSWDEALRELVIEPLGLAHTEARPSESLRHSTAVGHGSDGRETPQGWALPRSIGPAGSITSSIGDLLRFAAEHLQPAGATAETRLLSVEAVDAMQANHISHQLDLRVEGGSWGMGWERRRWRGTDVIGHNGITLGQTAFLWLSPEHRTAVGLLTNSASGPRVFRRILVDLSGETPVSSDLPKLDSVVDDQQAIAVLTRCAGTYRNDSGEITISAGRTPTSGTMRYRPIGSKLEFLPSEERTFAMSVIETDLAVLTDLRHGERSLLRLDFSSDSVFYDMRIHRRAE